MSPNAHHLALLGSLSQAKWCTIRALHQPADFLHISSRTHTLSSSWSLSTHISLPALFFLVLCFCIAFGPTAKCKAHIKVLSAPSNLCCHLDVGSLQLPVPGEVQSSNVKGQIQELTGGGSSLAQDGECSVTKGNSKRLSMNNAQPSVYCWVYGVFLCLSLGFSSLLQCSSHRRWAKTELSKSVSSYCQYTSYKQQEDIQTDGK